LTSTGNLTTAARRIGLVALLLLLGLLGAAMVGSGVFPATAGAAKCLDCEGEEPGEEAEAQILTIQVQGPGSVATATKTVCENTGGGLETCELEVAEGKKVTLSATPASGFTFTGWSGACTGTGACEVTMTSAKSVTATFADTTPPAAPTITSPTPGQLLERASEEPVTVSFNNSGDGSAVSFLCRLDIASSAGASGCSPPSWSTGNLSAGTHTVYVWAKDASGNVSSPASRSFEVVIAPPKEEGGSGGGGSDTGGGGGSAQPEPVVIVDRIIDAQPFVKWRLLGKKTVFRKLMLKGLPAGAKVTATCAGRGCPFKRRQVEAPQGVADLTKSFGGRRLAANVLIRLEPSAAGYMGGPMVEVKTRAGKPPKVTKR
jgi:uncharacterized repeat protein (TIGR02543 family)